MFNVKSKLLLGAFLATVIIAGFGVALSFGSAQNGTNESGIISSNATWTQAGSPYTLTGNVLVNEGIILTIEAGVTVNLNNYYITVNGALVAKGTSTDKIQINGVNGGGPFMPPPAPNPLPYNYGINFTELSIGYNAQTGSGSIIENAVINSTTLALESSPKIDNNTINGYITSNGTSVISNNIVAGSIDLTGPSIVLNNHIYGSVLVQTNVVGGSIEDSSNPQGTPMISNNVINGSGLNGIGISFLTASTSNIIIFSNTITDCNNAGITAEGIGVIENNLIANNHDGIDIEGPNTVVNNTIENNYIGIQQVNNFDFPTVLYNNIQNNSYNFFLHQYVAGSINATYNWWGTTNQTVISNSIYDSKGDSSLGTVNFVPFLTAPNPQAPNLNTPSPTPAVPEFPTNTVPDTDVIPISTIINEFIFVVVIILAVVVSLLLYRRHRKTAKPSQ
jgi:hypothetical protein